jgi:predicted TIM-barrel enzyme
VDPVSDKSDQDIAEDMVSIAFGHAQIAFAKQAAEREAYLQQCRLNWQADAFAVSGNQEGSESYAEELDRVTRKVLSAMLLGGSSPAGAA